MTAGNEENDKIPASIREALKPSYPAGVLTLDGYRAALKGIQPPTNQQISNFTAFVCDAHSWYKHLPLLPPGSPFTFFLDPFAGYDILHTPTGVQHQERFEGERGFHYTCMPTIEYRKEYGCLQYQTGSAPQFLLGTEVGILDTGDQAPGLISVDGKKLKIPAEIVQAGRVELTGVIHPLAPRTWLWAYLAAPSGEWPEQTGGAATLARIRKICDQAKQTAREEGYFADRIDDELKAIIEPERRRLVGEMTRTMRRVRSLLFSN